MDYPHLVRRLVIAGTSYRLGPVGKEIQMQYAQLLADGRYRESARAMAPLIADSGFSQWIVGWMMWVIEPLGRSADASDMIKTLLAEDDFNAEDSLHKITALTLVIGGDRDIVYPPELVRRTAELIPNAQCIMYKGRKHSQIFTDLRFVPDTISFLTQ